MAHNTRTQLDATWLGAGYAPTPADLMSLESKIFKGINGDDGGVYAPATPININTGAGLKLTGPLKVWGPSGTLKSTSGARFAFGDNDFPVFPAGHPAQTRTLISPCMQGTSGPGSSFNGFSSIPRFDYMGRQMTALGWLPSLSPMPAPRTVTASSPSAPCTLFGTLGAGVFLPGTLYVPLRVHHGATITTATFSFRVGVAHAVTPTMPKARIIRVAKDGTKTLLTSVAAGADVNGWVPYSGTFVTWFDNQALKSWTIACDVAGSNVIDTSLYSYFAEIVEESGPTLAVPSIKCPVNLATTGNVNRFSCPATIDGFAIPVTQIRVLLWLQTDPTENGIYMSPAGGAGGQFIRDTDMSSADATLKPWSANVLGSAIFCGASGTANNNVWFQQTSPTLQFNGFPGSVSTAPVTFDKVGSAAVVAAAQGNIWIAVACQFTNITDGKFQ